MVLSCKLPHPHSRVLRELAYEETSEACNSGINLTWGVSEIALGQTFPLQGCHCFLSYLKSGKLTMRSSSWNWKLSWRTLLMPSCQCQPKRGCCCFALLHAQTSTLAWTPPRPPSCLSLLCAISERRSPQKYGCTGLTTALLHCWTCLPVGFDQILSITPSVTQGRGTAQRKPVKCD